MTPVLAGFLLGLAGSAHCLGMCGPLVLLSRGQRRWGAFLAHHAARVTIYVGLGAIAGVGGGAIARSGWPNGLALTAGVVLIAQATGVMGRLMGAGPGRFIGVVAAQAGRHLPRQPLARAAAFGAINGLMPCGLLYGALAAAAGLGDARASVGFVVAFACGSLPAFTVLVYSAHAFVLWTPRRWARAAPIALALLGALLIARGWPATTGHDMASHSVVHAASR